MSFNCSGCGCCCRRIKNAVEATKGIDILAFPYSWDESGKCDKLGEDNKCMVYEDRPLLCNVDKLKEMFGYDEESFYESNRKACNSMMDQDLIPLEFRV